MADCVIALDVLEHIFISDIPNVLRDIFSNSNNLVILNIASYPATARLPNGENAHITIRPSLWWKGMIDSIAIEYPSILILLLVSNSIKRIDKYPIWKADSWNHSKTFTTTCY